MNEEMKKTSCVAIIAKFLKIKEIGRRQGYITLLNNVNEEFKDSIASELILTENNEICGLLNSGRDLPKILLAIKREFYRYDLYFGVGIVKSSDTEENCEINELAYSLANQALDIADENRRKKGYVPTDVNVRMNGDHELVDLSINTIYELLYSIEKNWTDKQREVINFMIFEGATQAKAAEVYGVTASNIQQMLVKGNYFTYNKAIKMLDLMFISVSEGN